MPGDWSAASGYQAGQILARMNDVTAVFAANDHLALGILRALHEKGQRVPEDISVVGFDDVPEAAYFIPPLTTIRPDFDAVAAASLDLLIAQIREGHRLGDRRILAPTLVKRESVAPPRIHFEPENRWHSGQYATTRSADRRLLDHGTDQCWLVPPLQVHSTS